jgi:hypothetical protein
MADETLLNKENDQARGLLGDTSRESAAAKSIDELNLIDPSSVEKPKRGRKPGVAKTAPVIVVNAPTPAQIALGENIVEAQAIAFTGIVAMFSTPESSEAIYKLHVEKHSKKLALAFANVAMEYGVEVSGKMAAVSMLCMAEVSVFRDCWEAWEPKSDDEEEESK